MTKQKAFREQECDAYRAQIKIQLEETQEKLLDLESVGASIFLLLVETVQAGMCGESLSFLRWTTPG